MKGPYLSLLTVEPGVAGVPVVLRSGHSKNPDGTGKVAPGSEEADVGADVVAVPTDVGIAILMLSEVSARAARPPSIAAEDNIFLRAMPLLLSSSSGELPGASIGRFEG